MQLRKYVKGVINYFRLKSFNRQDFRWNQHLKRLQCLKGFLENQFGFKPLKNKDKVDQVSDLISVIMGAAGSTSFLIDLRENNIETTNVKKDVNIVIEKSKEVHRLVLIGEDKCIKKVKSTMEYVSNESKWSKYTSRSRLIPIDIIIVKDLTEFTKLSNSTETFHLIVCSSVDSDQSNALHCLPAPKKQVKLSDTSSPTPDILNQPPDTSSPTPDIPTSPPDLSSQSPNISTSTPDISTTTPDTSPDTKPTILDMSTPPQDKSSPPPVISTSAPVISTSPPVISTSPPVISTSPPVISTSPPVISTPPQYISTRPPDMSTEQPYISTSLQDISTPTPELSTPTSVISTSPRDTSDPPPDISTPSSKKSYPPQRMSTSPRDTSDPQPDISTPSPTKSYPPPDISTPKPDMSTPPSDISPQQPNNSTHQIQKLCGLPSIEKTSIVFVREERITDRQVIDCSLQLLQHEKLKPYGPNIPIITFPEKNFKNDWETLAMFVFTTGLLFRSVFGAVKYKSFFKKKSKQ